MVGVEGTACKPPLLLGGILFVVTPRIDPILPIAAAK